MQKEKTSVTKKLVEGGILIGLAYAFSFMQYSGNWLQGGSISLEMIPIIIMGLRHGMRWGLGTGFIFGSLSLITGFQNVLYCPDFISQAGCILLDYLLAFTVLGMADPFVKLFSRLKDNKPVNYGLATFVVCFFRFVCHFISGIWLWGAYAPEGQPVVLYSLIYNGTYMLVDTVLAIVIIVVLYGSSPRIFSDSVS